LARKILLADDSVTAQNMGRRILTDAGYEVTTVNNGSAALKKLAELKPDIVVLDVYMPGYGGLEVCQRIKENKDTARIPVLLSVGKLEPFKPDEARRVRADAYIVKPFEASELLTALTKLEDKIVPQAEPIKPGRFAKAIAAAEETPANSFGDADSGWKERLKIPHPAVKDSEPDLIPEPFTKASPSVLPPDITSEEIAALQAAAAALNAKAESTSEDEPSVLESNTLEPAAAEATSPVVETESPTEEVPATFASAASEESSSEPAPVAQEVPEIQSQSAQVEPTEAIEQVRPQSNVVSALIEKSIEATDRGLNSDDEVMAALASLGASSDVSPVSSESRLQSAIAAVDLVVAANNVTGPRWVAEAVPLSLDEAAFVLEQEMQKQYAAFAAADAVYAKLSARASSSSSDDSSVAIAEMPPVPSGNVESVVAESQSPEQVTADLTPESSSFANDQESFAAAAGASAAAASETSTEVADQDAKEPGEAQRDSEMAAAWTNWKQIRESILGSQTAVQISPAAEFPVTTEQPKAVPEPESDQSAKSEPNTSDAISSIVDNMLAELKPKLMEEIAKKLKSDKN
jgi:twitching motility two-component system response regulator PilH